MGLGGILGAFGIHGPDHDGGAHGGLPHGGLPHLHLPHFGGGGMGGGDPRHGDAPTGLMFGMDDKPMGLILGDPEAAAAHHYSLAAIPIGGGWTVSIVAVLMALCLLAIMVSATYRMVAVHRAQKQFV